MIGERNAGRSRIVITIFDPKNVRPDLFENLRRSLLGSFLYTVMTLNLHVIPILPVELISEELHCRNQCVDY
jgi:hypothetical protein